MSAKKANPNNPFEVNQDYWNQWQELFGAWQKNVSGDGNVPNASAYQKLFTDAGQAFLDMTSQFLHRTEEDHSAADIAKDWAENLYQNFARSFHPRNGPQDLGDWQDSMAKTGAAWHKMYTHPGAVHGFQSWPVHGQQPGFGQFDPFGFFANMPGIGYTREKQEDISTLYTLWAEFEKISQQYNLAMAQIGMDAAREFQEYIADPPPDEEPLSSLKDIFTKWVDICEELYAEYAMTKEYTELYGEVVNALMGYKKHLQEMADDFVDGVGLPTRKETDSLHARVQVLRRENATLKKEVNALKEAVFGKEKKETKVKAKIKSKKTAKKTTKKPKGKKK